jgi:peroxiredoxin
MSAAPIAEQVRSIKTERSGEPPSPFDREQERLAETLPDGVIAVGQRLPDAQLLDVQGASTSLEAQLGARRAVLVFYRGAWCPFCNIALRAYQAELLPALKERRVSLLAVSPQKPDGSLSMQEKHDLQFGVLSDPGNALAVAAGILTAPSAEARAAQLALGLDLTVVNVDATTSLPMPSTVILDADRTVRWIDVHPDYATRSEPREIIAALDALES